jgi:2,4'-dihydroxyacetophenone dioxygenase
MEKLGWIWSLQVQTCTRRHPRPIDSSKTAYQLPQPMGMVPITLIAGALALDGDERESQVQRVWFKPLLLNVGHGYYINIL